MKHTGRHLLAACLLSAGLLTGCAKEEKAPETENQVEQIVLGNPESQDILTLINTTGKTIKGFSVKYGSAQAEELLKDGATAPDQVKLIWHIEADKASEPAELQITLDDGTVLNITNVKAEELLKGKDIHIVIKEGKGCLSYTNTDGKTVTTMDGTEAKKTEETEKTNSEKPETNTDASAEDPNAQPAEDPNAGADASVPTEQEPAAPAPVPQEPVYQEPAVQEPVYQEPTYQEPVYQEPTYQVPVYQEPTYQEPVVQQPVEAPVIDVPSIPSVDNSSSEGCLGIGG